MKVRMSNKLLPDFVIAIFYYLSGCEVLLDEQSILLMIHMSPDAS